VVRKISLPCKMPLERSYTVVKIW